MPGAGDGEVIMENDDARDEIVLALARGLSVRQIAKEFGLTLKSVHDVFKELGGPEQIRKDAEQIMEARSRRSASTESDPQPPASAGTQPETEQQPEPETEQQPEPERQTNEFVEMFAGLLAAGRDGDHGEPDRDPEPNDETACQCTKWAMSAAGGEHVWPCPYAREGAREREIIIRLWAVERAAGILRGQKVWSGEHAATGVVGQVLAVADWMVTGMLPCP